MLKIPKYTFGVGDRFAHQAKAQLQAFIQAAAEGADVVPVYDPIRRSIQKFDAGLHIKTAGTNWLEEVIGLAEAGGEGLEMAKAIYVKTLFKKEECHGESL